MNQKTNKSFFKKILDIIRFNDDDEEDYEAESFLGKKRSLSSLSKNKEDLDEDEYLENDQDKKYDMIYQEETLLAVDQTPPKEEDHILAVDVYETRDSLYVLAFTGGTRKNDISINLSRTTIFIQGERSMPYFNGADAEYHSSELLWGKFSREIMLPEEVEIELTDAKEENGLLTVKLTKVDRQKTARIKVL